MQRIQDIWLKIKFLLEGGIHEWGLILIVFLVALASFGLGRLSSVESSQQPVSITQSASAVLPRLLPLGGQYVAARTGSVYYFPWCGGATKILPQNQIWFPPKKPLLRQDTGQRRIARVYRASNSGYNGAMLVVDVEATGVEPKKHSIVSIGALDLAHPTNRFYMECRVWDGAHIMDEALAVNGFTREQVLDASKPSEADLTHAFLAWSESLDERTFAGQNVSFDRDFLKEAAERAGHTDWPFAHRTLDTHTMCYVHMVHKGLQPPVKHRRSALNLDAVLEYCGIPEEPSPHNALTGALSHAEVISRLLYGRKLLPEFAQFEIPWKVA